MSTEKCVCSSATLQIDGCCCGYREARTVKVRVIGFVDVKIAAKTDLALSQVEKDFFAQTMVSAGELFADGLREMRNGD